MGVKKNEREELEIFMAWNRLFLYENSAVDHVNRFRALTNILLIHNGPYEKAEMLRRRDEEMRIELKEWLTRREIPFSDERGEKDDRSMEEEE